MSGPSSGPAAGQKRWTLSREGVVFAVFRERDGATAADAAWEAALLTRLYPRLAPVHVEEGPDGERP